MTTKHLVFVYGTLKEGYGNHYLLSQSKKVGDGQTRLSYAMYDCGGFPIVFDDETPVAPVSGQIYEIDDATLANLDRLEGNGHMFTRQEIKVLLADDMDSMGELNRLSATPWMYFGTPSGWTNRGRLEKVPVTAGTHFDWKPRRWRMKYRDSASIQPV